LNCLNGQFFGVEIQQMETKMKTKAITAALIALLLAGCGGGDSDTSSAAPAASPPVPAAWSGEPVEILFVGNSYTFGRVAPALQYNNANISDLTARFNDISPATNAYSIGSGVPPSPCAIAPTATPTVGCFEAKPWGGVPGIFKALTEQAGLNYVVSMSTRNAATLRGHFLNTGDSLWDLRGNIASKKWDVVVLQGQSDEPLPRAKSKNGNPVSFNMYARLIQEYVHTGTGGTTTEAVIFGSLNNCRAAVTAAVPGPGLSTGNCNSVRDIKTNTFANPNAKVYLMQTWARPDMVEAHKCTAADQTTLDGAPIVDPTCDAGSNGSTVTGMNTLYYTSKTTTAANLADMTTDMGTAFSSLAATTTTVGARRFAGVLPVGSAFQRAVDAGVVKSSGFYKPDGTFDDSGSLMNLWWKDSTHASKFGSYLSALVSFGSITGLDPTRFGRFERAAQDLGITADQSLTLQQMAKETLLGSGMTLR
jgi:hypothetical protein